MVVAYYIKSKNLFINLIFIFINIIVMLIKETIFCFESIFFNSLFFFILDSWHTRNCCRLRLNTWSQTWFNTCVAIIIVFSLQFNSKCITNLVIIHMVILISFLFHLCEKGVLNRWGNHWWILVWLFIIRLSVSIYIQSFCSLYCIRI